MERGKSLYMFIHSQKLANCFGMNFDSSSINSLINSCISSIVYRRNSILIFDEMEKELNCQAIGLIFNEI